MTGIWEVREEFDFSRRLGRLFAILEEAAAEAGSFHEPNPANERNRWLGAATSELGLVLPWSAPAEITLLCDRSPPKVRHGRFRRLHPNGLDRLDPGSAFLFLRLLHSLVFGRVPEPGFAPDFPASLQCCRQHSRRDDLPRRLPIEIALGVSLRLSLRPRSRSTALREVRYDGGHKSLPLRSRALSFFPLRPGPSFPGPCFAPGNLRPAHRIPDELSPPGPDQHLPSAGVGFLGGNLVPRLAPFDTDGFTMAGLPAVGRSFVGQ